MEFGALENDKAADISPEGFEELLNEFSSDFAPLRGLAKELHALIFPMRDGKIFTGTGTDQMSVQGVYNGMADAFHRSAPSFQCYKVSATFTSALLETGTLSLKDFCSISHTKTAGILVSPGLQLQG